MVKAENGGGENDKTLWMKVIFPKVYFSKNGWIKK